MAREKLRFGLFRENGTILYQATEDGSIYRLDSVFDSIVVEDNIPYLICEDVVAKGTAHVQISIEQMLYISRTFTIPIVLPDPILSDRYFTC